jgi:hypothetical protein
MIDSPPRPKVGEIQLFVANNGRDGALETISVCVLPLSNWPRLRTETRMKIGAPSSLT